MQNGIRMDDDAVAEERVGDLRARVDDNAIEQVGPADARAPPYVAVAPDHRRHHLRTQRTRLQVPAVLFIAGCRLTTLKCAQRQGSSVGASSLWRVY